jgi:8-oxo-dGTP diphosphatase
VRTAYVVGFLFSKFLDEVLLIEKQKPDWQKDLLNGVGGKIELGELPTAAMVREFKEETNIDSTPESWLFVARLQSSNSDVYFFVARSQHETLLGRFKAMTQEPVFAIRWREGGYPLVHNLPWLLPMCVDVLENAARLNPHSVTTYYGAADADVFHTASFEPFRIK